MQINLPVSSNVTIASIESLNLQCRGNIGEHAFIFFFASYRMFPKLSCAPLTRACTKMHVNGQQTRGTLIIASCIFYLFRRYPSRHERGFRIGLRHALAPAQSESAFFAWLFGVDRRRRRRLQRRLERGRRALQSVGGARATNIRT